MIAEVNVNAENDIILIQEPSLVELATYGIQGARGYSLHSGYGLPDPNLGIDLDLYLNLQNGYLYKKLTGAWAYQTYVSPQQKKYTITAQNIIDKFITLDPPPSSPSVVTLNFLNGTGQENGVDFKVTGSTLSWAQDLPNGVTGLEGFIAQNDIVIVRY